MIAGFTGTRHGMTDEQKLTVDRILVRHDVDEANHGDCVGGDEDFHNICLKLNIDVILHPPTNPKLRAFCKGTVLVHDPLPYLARNRVIVATSELLIATPKETTEPAPARGQGTWSTVREARRQGHANIWLVWPDGSFS